MNLHRRAKRPVMEVMTMLKSRILLLISVSALVFLPTASAKDDSRWLIPQSAVESTEIKIIWQYNLPMAKGESLDELLVTGNRLCALSSRNYLSCLNRNDANVMFNSYVAAEGLPVMEMQPYQDELITIVGNKLAEISADSGTEQTSTKITCGVTCPAVRNSSFFYVAGTDNRLHVFNADTKVLAFEVAAENGSGITSVMAEEEYVIFATKAGNVISIASDRPKKLWQFDAPAAIAGPIVRDDDSLYFACRDTCVYRIDLYSGELFWKYQAEAILDSSPQLGIKAVYQYIPEVGLAAIDKKSSKLLWQLPDGLGLLSEFGDKAFVITRAGVLVAMENVKAKQLYAIDIGQPVNYATNHADSKIYIGNANGRLACLEPAR